MTIGRRPFILASFAFTSGFAWFERLFAPQSELLDPYWKQLGVPGGMTIDHDEWTAFLQRTVTTDPDGVGRVSYGEVSNLERAGLADYRHMLQGVRPTELPRHEALAYWINLYNATTVATVLDHYPVASIRDITFGGALASGPWNEKLVTVEGRSLSLNDIEHGIVRPVFGDPRIHYALNCAAVGCPNLRASAWQAASLDQDLDAAARLYVNDPRGVTVRPAGALLVSSIYNWFQADFGGSEDAVLLHLRKFAEPELASALSESGVIDEYAYDWSLNDRES